MENKPLLDELRVALEAELAEIHSLSEGSGEARAIVTLDQQSVGRRRQQRVGMIQAALSRMDEGEYGYCASCGDAIKEGRLKVDPTAAVCVACAAS